MIKVSAWLGDRFIEAPAFVADTQEEVVAAFEAGELDRDVVVVVRFQGPRANGMPELHRLTTILGSLQSAGRRVALVTDGRMSGASGRIPAAIHLTPEAAAGGPIARVRTGDVVRFDAAAKTIDVVGDPSDLAERPDATLTKSHHSAWGAICCRNESQRDQRRRGRLHLAAPRITTNQEYPES